MKFKSISILFLCMCILTGCDGFGSFVLNKVKGDSSDNKEMTPVENAFTKFEDSPCYNFSLTIEADEEVTTIAVKEVDRKSRNKSFIVSKATLSDHKIDYITNDRGDMKYIDPLNNQSNRIAKEEIPNNYNSEYLVNKVLNIEMVKKELKNYHLDKKSRELRYQGKQDDLKNSVITIDDKNYLRSITIFKAVDAVETKIVLINNPTYLLYKNLVFDIQ